RPLAIDLLHPAAELTVDADDGGDRRVRGAIVRLHHRLSEPPRRSGGGGPGSDRRREPRAIEEDPSDGVAGGQGDQRYDAAEPGGRLLPPSRGALALLDRRRITTATRDGSPAARRARRRLSTPGHQLNPSRAPGWRSGRPPSCVPPHRTRSSPA